VVAQLDFVHSVRTHHFGEAWMCVTLWHIRYTGLYNKISVGYKNFVRTQGQPMLLFLPCEHFQHCHAEDAECQVEVIAIYGLQMHLIYCTL
jgi:hypothetical protein